jgi:hypothetical protein
VLTAADLAPLGLHWMPTLAGDKQMVLADGKVLFQGQEVAFVVATDRYIAADAIELVEVDYEELPVIVDPFKALEPYKTEEAPLITSICSMVSVGTKLQLARPASPDKMGMSSTKTITRLPAPKEYPLPERICGSSSTMFTPGTWLNIWLTVVVFLFSIRAGRTTSIETVNSSRRFSYFPSDFTIISPRVRTKGFNLKSIFLLLLAST